MVITVAADLEAALRKQADAQGIAPEVLAVTALRQRFLGMAAALQPQDDWERRLRSAATDCGVSLSNEAVSTEGLYE